MPALPRRTLTLLALTGLVAALTQPLAPQPASAYAPQIGIDDLRTSWDRDEPGLSPEVVGSPAFGPLFSTPVEGQVYAQPVTAGGTLVAATEANRAYGLDPATGAVRWERSFGRAWSPTTLNCGDLLPTIGITSTPVYDAGTNTVYMMAKVDDGPDPRHPHWYLHAVDATTGAERPEWPVRIEGAPSNDPGQRFDPLTAMQRPGLLLLGGVVYAGFASHCDASPYVGYVVGVDAARADISTIWATETGSSHDEGGIWQSGAGLVSDGPDSIIVTTGNGLSPAPGPGRTPPGNLGESVVRLRVGADRTLTAVDFFSPANNLRLDQDDADLGSGGPLALPVRAGTAAHPHLLVQIGKDGRVYLLDRDDLGGMGQAAGGTDRALGVTGPYGALFGKPAYFGGGGGGGHVYVVEANGRLRAHAVRRSADGRPALVSVGTSTDTFGFSAGSPVVTSVGDDPRTALVWTVHVRDGSGAGAELRAYDALPDADGILRQRFAKAIGTAAKFSSVATDGGRVYVGTRDGRVWGFGAPTTAGVSGTGTDFGQVAVGAGASRLVRLTATRAVTVTGVRTEAPFTTAGTGGRTTLAKGQTLDVRVGFAPARPAQSSGTLTVDLVSGGRPETATLSLTGYGTQDGVVATPGGLDFGELVAGGPRELSVSITNVGTTPTRITGFTAPRAPLTVSGLRTGQVLAPQASVAVSVLADPTAAGTLADALTVTAATGPALRVPFTGTVVSGAPRLELPEVLDVGEVPIGTAVTRDFPITSAGNVRMTITKAKPPAGAFTSASPLAEGLTVAAGDTIHQPVTFRPTVPGPVQESYLITADDGTGMRTVVLRGTGVEDPITALYEQLGGATIFPPSLLGSPMKPQAAVAGGRMQEFVRGSIYWSPETGAHYVLGAVNNTYVAEGGPAGPLGFPVTDELTTPDGTGRYTHFSRAASVYWTPATGAHAVHGAIRERWAALGWEQGPTGYPTTSEVPGTGGTGRRNDFSNGATISWTPATGAHALQGLIKQRWDASGAEAGPLGSPTTDELTTPGGSGRYNHLSRGGSIYWSERTGAHGVYGAIRQTWAANGWEQGRYGYPTGEEHDVPGGRRSDFERGSITWLR